MSFFKELFSGKPRSRFNSGLMGSRGTRISRQSFNRQLLKNNSKTSKRSPRRSPRRSSNRTAKKRNSNKGNK